MAEQINTGSPSYSTNSADWKKIGKGAIIAILGAVLTYGSSIIGHVDFTYYTPLVTAVWSVIVNAGWKFIANNQVKNSVA